MTNVMYGINYHAPSGLGMMSKVYIIGLYPVLAHDTPSGLHVLVSRVIIALKGLQSINDGVSYQT